MDRRLKWVVGRGWVVIEVASVMIFFEWVCSGGFHIVVGSWSWFALVVVGFQIGSGDDFFLSAWVCVCLFLCLCLWFVVCSRG